MKWLFRWIRHGINTIDKEDRYEEAKDIGRAIPSVGLSINKARRAGLKVDMTQEGHINLNQHPMHFKIYPATGGHIVEYAYYNEKRDTNDQALHLIPSDLDLGAELAKIMTLEAFKR